MKCVICKHGNTKPGTITATFEREGATIVVKSVPADVCESCGELLGQAEAAAKAGVQVDIQKYVAA
ncbi:type II toxin-antitoxin system MqsA family antitoxin [Bdellovibrionota bacterium FG-1]